MSEKDRVQGMLGAAKRWELVKPKLVVAGSSAQTENVLADAIHDIGALWRACTNAADEISRLNRALADARNAALEEAANECTRHAKSELPIHVWKWCPHIKGNLVRTKRMGAAVRAKVFIRAANAILSLKEKAE